MVVIAFSVCFVLFGFFFLKVFLFLNVFFFIVDNLFMLAYALSTPLEVFLHLMFFLMP